ncbi:MAG: ATP-binding protein [Flavobacteriales bacterium]|jgi:two-component system sensor histidine kinase/response regulator
MSDVKRILYLDDEENNLVAFKALFRRDYEVYTTTSPQEAVQLLNEHLFQVILSDQKMPDISGVEFFELTITDFPDAVRVLVTGYADIEAVIDAINKGGVYRYVAKPWDENDLRICIENAFDKFYSRIELKEKNNALQQANSDLEKFIYSASHDLRAPLVTIKGIIQLAKMDELGDKADGYFQMIEKSVARLDTFVQNIIHYYQNSKEESHIQKVDFHAFIDDLINQYRIYDGADAIVVKKEVVATGDFYADNYRLKIILGNLISNAIKFQDRNKESRELEISVIQNNEKVILKVGDNGIGFNATLLESTNDMLSSDTHKSPGTGVGLYLVREAIRKMGGKIQLVSNTGEHTRFIIEIPNKA